MAYASIAEVKACLVDCLDYCKDHPEVDYCAHYGPQLAEVVDEVRQGYASTDRYFSKWRREAGQDKVSWKALAKHLRGVQDQLGRIDAIGYPDRRVRYWDEEILEGAIREMMAYLAEHGDDIPFADDQLSRFEQLLSSAHGEDDESADALRTYQRHFEARRDALSNANHVLAEFRDSIRRDLGKDNSDYQSIRWAWSVSPDESVL